MRLLTWNVGHQTRPKALPARLAVPLACLQPDALVLTEYVYHEAHEAFFGLLASVGLKHRAVSARVSGQNQVVIVARDSLEAGHCVAPAGLSEAVGANWLHVRLGGGVHVVGLRRPMFQGVPRGVARYWAGVAHSLASLREQPSVAIGDFNCDATAGCLAPLRTQGWTVATPLSGWSFRGKNGSESAIDHALLTPALASGGAAYLSSFAGLDASYSDHAVLMLDVVEAVDLHVSGR
jgi:hypothetical protein